MLGLVDVGRVSAGLFAGVFAVGALAQEADPKIALGKRLFNEKRLTNPGSDWMANCASCHIPPDEPGRDRMFTDVVPLSLLPSVGHREKRLTLRNAPSLLDTGQMPKLYWDGRYNALEPLVEDKITGTHFGWAPDTKAQAVDEIASMIQLDNGELATQPYTAEFKTAYGVDVQKASHGEIVKAAAQAIADYVRTLHTTTTSKYDAFAYMNRVQKQVDIDAGDTPSDFAGRVEGNMMNQEGRNVIKVPEGWEMLAYEGMKIFYRYYGEEKAGNCVQCHYPPRFTDFKFHNTGVAQLQYESAHDEGSFAKLEIPDGGERPVERLSTFVSRQDPSHVDLGYWNFAPAEELESAVGAFKTPSLRDLQYTGPYMHTGAYQTLTDVVMHYVKASKMAREGTLVNAPEALKNMYITQEEVPALVAFLEQLNEVPEEHYRDLIVQDIHVLKGPFKQW